MQNDYLGNSYFSLTFTVIFIKHPHSDNFMSKHGALTINRAKLTDYPFFLMGKLPHLTGTKKIKLPISPYHLIPGQHFHPFQAEKLQGAYHVVTRKEIPCLQNTCKPMYC